jgi:hypothetical protein
MLSSDVVDEPAVGCLIVFLEPGDEDSAVLEEVYDLLP